VESTTVVTDEVESIIVEAEKLTEVENIKWKI